MSIDTLRDPAFWMRVAADESCPAELRQALLSGDDTDRQRFEIADGKAMRAYLATVPGWIGKRKKRPDESAADYKKSTQPLANFHDGRGGRIQQRIIIELPSEASMAARVRMLKRFCHEFERRQLPFNAAMHAPDHGSDERQWHAHLDYYHRPVRRVTQADVDEKRAEGLVPDGNVVGQWDFEARFFEGRRRDRFRRPFRQNTLEEVRGEEWIPYLRARLAFIVNDELRVEGQVPRYDPRSYHEMGIKADPGEHMGVKLNAAEGKGEVSATGLSNERKQWEAIENALEAKFTAANDNAASAAEQRRRRLSSLNLPAAQVAAIETGIQSIVTLSKLEADASYEGAITHELAARACSRAKHIFEKNDRVLTAFHAGLAKLSENERDRRLSLREAASSYLERLSPFQEAVRDTVQRSDASRAHAVAQARTTGRVVERLLAEAEANAKVGKVGVPHDKERPVFSAEKAFEPVAAVAAAPQEDPNQANWINLVRQRRPMVQQTRHGFDVTEHRGSPWIHDKNVQAVLRDLFDAQEREVDDLIRASGFGLSLARRSDGWHLNGRGAEAARRFLTLRIHPRVADEIARVMMHPGAVSRPSAPSAIEWPERSAGASTASAAPISRPTEKTIAPPGVQSPNPSVRQAGNVDDVVAATQGGDVRAERRHEGRAMSNEPTKQTVTSVDQIIKDGTPVTIDRNGMIDVVALARRGIIIEERHKADARLIGRAKAQADHARRAVVAFVKKAPGFIVERDGRYSLSSRTKADIATLARDYDSPALQIVLQTVWEQHHADAVRQTIETPAPTVPRFTAFERDDEAIAAAKAYNDEQRRRAAVLALNADAPATGNAGQSSSPPSPSRGAPRRLPPGWDRNGPSR